MCIECRIDVRAPLSLEREGQELGLVVHPVVLVPDDIRGPDECGRKIVKQVAERIPEKTHSILLIIIHTLSTHHDQDDQAVSELTHPRKFSLNDNHTHPRKFSLPRAGCSFLNLMSCRGGSKGEAKSIKAIQSSVKGREVRASDRFDLMDLPPSMILSSLT